MEMQTATTCPACGAFSSGGAFCTSCGASIAPIAEIAVPKKKSRVGLFVIIGLVFTLVAGGGATFYVLTKESPAVAYLISACRIFNEADLVDGSTNDRRAIESRARRQVNSALDLDAELAAPFQRLLRDADDLTDTWQSVTTSLTVALLLNDFSYDSSAYDDYLDQEKDFQESIKTTCAPYKAKSGS